MSRISLRLALLCFLNHLCLGVDPTPAFQCDNLTTPLCACQKSSDVNMPRFEVDCPYRRDLDNTYGIQVIYLPNTTLKIECLPPVDEEYSMAPMMGTDDPLNFLANISIYPAKELIIEYCNFSDFIVDNDDGLNVGALLTQVAPIKLRWKYELFHNGRFELPYLDAIAEQLLAIEFVELENGNLVEIPYAFFGKMRNLRKLCLKSNQLTNVTGPFNEHLEELDLASNHITYIDPDAFRGLRKLQTLHLWSNRIAQLDGRVFSDLHVLKSLELMSNDLRTLPAEIFSKLKQLQQINLSRNDLESLPDELFANNAELVSVRLENNQRLSMLPVLLFKSCLKLEKLSLNGMNLTEVINGTFAGLSNVRTLNLSRNRLTTISKWMFHSMINLSVLDLGHNAIAAIDEEAFNFNGNLTELDLGSNQIRTMPQFIFRYQEKLTRLVLSHNDMTINDIYIVTPFNFLISVETLDLSHNKLDYIPSDIRTKPNLRELLLSHNKFTTLDFTELDSASEKLMIDLSFNQIATLKEMDLMERILKVNRETESNQKQRHIIVNIGDNPVKCDCSNYDLYRYVNLLIDDAFLKVYEIKLDGLKCAAPADRRDEDFAKARIPMYLYSTPTCPGSCTCYHRPSDNRIVVDCQHNNLTKVPSMFIPAINNNTSAQCLSGDSEDEVVVEIILKANFIRSLTADSFSKVNVTILDVSYNNLTAINRIPKGLKELRLDHNDLRRIDKSVLDHLENVTLDHNPWVCDCDTLPLWNYLGDHIIPNKTEIRCYDSNRVIRLLSREKLCPSYEKIIITLVVVIATMIIIVAIAIALYYKYNQEIKVFLFSRNLCLWFVTEEDLDKDKTYDAFISFSQHDELFIIEELLPKLENPINPYKICVHMRNWIPGEFITKQVVDSVQNSRRTIVVLSPSFLESVWGKMEFRAAHLKALSDGVARVIVILYGDLDPNDEKIDEELRLYLKTNTYIRWGDPWFWDKLRYALPHRKSPISGNSSAYLNKRVEAIHAKVDKLHMGNQNVNIAVNGPPLDPLLLKANRLEFRPANETPPAEKGVMQ